jgi:formylglycine-generating enzyme required for sulfatase activity
VLEARADELWPAIPANDAALESWLIEASSLATRAPNHERALASLRKSAVSDHPWKFENAELQWQHDTLAELADRLARFRDPSPVLGTIASVKKRLDDSRKIARESLGDAEHLWRAAIASIADEAQCPAYRGLAIRAQIGLVPIGRDVASGLFEFADLRSGAAPERAADGRLEMKLDSAIVLVLVPGGRFHMGSATPAPGRSPARADTTANEDESPDVEIELAPFFVAKHEMTRAQWRRMSGGAPSNDEWQLLPVASVSWSEAALALAHSGLALPTEAQWEYAARAGTTSRWWCGSEPGSLRGAANGGGPSDPRLARDEVRANPKAVDALRANAFGLVHVHGNVAEWTRDTYAPYTVPPAPIDGRRNATENGLRAVRGGSYASSAAEMRSAARAAVAKDNHDPLIGIRAARALDPAPKRP